MISVGSKKPNFRILLEQRQRSYVYSVVVVRKLKTREHTLDEGALARSRLAYDPYQTVERGKISLRHPYAEVVYPRTASRRVIRTVYVAYEPAVVKRHASPPNISKLFQGRGS